MAARIHVAVAVGLALAACAPKPIKAKSGGYTPSPHVAAEKTIVARAQGAAQTEFEASYIAPDCKNKTVGVVEVSRCGLPVFADVYDDAAVNRFATKVCAVDLASEPMTSACAQKLEEKFAARLAERYELADWQAVTIRCTGHPEDCDGRAMERWALESHNKAALDRYRAAREQVTVAELRADAAGAEEAQEAAASAAAAAKDRQLKAIGTLRNVFDSLSHGTHCESYGTLTGSAVHCVEK